MFTLRRRSALLPNMSAWWGLALLVVAVLLVATTRVANGQSAARSARVARVGLVGAGCHVSGVTIPRALRTAAGSLTWRAGLVPWTTWPVAVGSARLSVDLIVARVDPRRVALELAIVRDGSALAPWRIDNAPDDAVIALNAGQFTDDGPWGLVVHRGREWQPAGSGSLAAAFVIDSSGGARIVSASDIALARARGGIREAVQSYPQLLSGGAVPAALCDSNAVHPTHRDIRLAIGTMADGSVLIVLSRYAGMGRAADRAPIGPTTHEMALVMATLGARDAVLLDGGLSGQLRIRDGVRDGIRDNGAMSKTHDWSGLRGVPLALIGRPAAELASPSSSR